MSVSLAEHRLGGRDLAAAARRATAESFPAEWAELAAFAAGARVQLDDLVLLNLRGDLGLVDGGIGCSDLAWRRERSVIAHNEDGAPEDVGRCALLTMTGTGRPSVTAFWYPGFVPANAFALTGDGLVWTVDHLPVASPGPGAGRHFIGRGLQRAARTVDQVIGYLRAHPSAGGFAYTIGDRAGRVVSAEAAAGRLAAVEAGPGPGPLLWHTNHGRYLPGAEPEAGGTSAARIGTFDGGYPVPAGPLTLLAVRLLLAPLERYGAGDACRTHGGGPLVIPRVSARVRPRARRRGTRARGAPPSRRHRRPRQPA